MSIEEKNGSLTDSPIGATCKGSMMNMPPRWGFCLFLRQLGFY